MGHHKRNHISGDKVSGKHTTIIDGIGNFVSALRDSSAVEQIQLGRIEHIRRGTRSSARRVTVKHRHFQGKRTGWLDVTLRTPLYIQTIGVEAAHAEDNLVETISALARKHLRGIDIVDKT